jgi:hypothetical protein
MKIQNVIAVTGSIINIIVYFFESLSHFVGGNIYQFEVIKNFFYFEKKKQRNLFLFHKSNSTPSKYFYTHKNIGDQLYSDRQKNNKNIISSPFQLTLKEKERNNIIYTDNEKNLNKFNITIKKFSHSNLNNNKITYNNFINDNSTNKHINDKSSSDIQILKKINDSNLKTQNNNNYNLYDEDINLKNFLIEKFKMIFFFYCYSRKNNPSKFFRKLSYNILDLYYITLIQSNRYLGIIKQFEFIKKILLNEGQNNSLLLLKKLNLRNKEDRVSIIINKNKKIENSVISYFRNIIGNGSVSKTDYLIFKNLSNEIKNKI